jgi:hypothetical protein
MNDQHNWDWTPGSRTIADLRRREGDFEWREEFQVSPDGERIATVVKLGESSTVCVSGDFWYLEFDKIWYVRYSPDGRLTALALVEGDWTLVVDEKLWPETYTYLWGTMFDLRGENIAAAVQQEMRYGMVVNGEIWGTLFENANSFTISPSGGSTAAVVQTVSLGQADTETFAKGCYSVAVNGEVWDRNFVNAWTPVFDKHGKRVAAQVRTTLHEYTIAVDGKAWPVTYPSVWEPCFDSDGSVLAPVRPGPGWAVARDGRLVCKPEFTQLWGLQSVNGHIYAIVAPGSAAGRLPSIACPGATTGRKRSTSSQSTSERPHRRAGQAGQPLDHDRRPAVLGPQVRHDLGPGLQPRRVAGCRQGRERRPLDDRRGRPAVPGGVRRGLGTRIRTGRRPHPDPGHQGQRLPPHRGKAGGVRQVTIHDVYAFVSGPLVWVAFAVFFGGLLYKLLSLALLARKKDPMVYEYMSFKYAMRSILRWNIPYATRNMRLHPVTTFVWFTFHFCLIVAPVFLSAHLILLEEAFGVASRPCPTVWPTS